MIAWAGRLHKRLYDIKGRAATVLWYRLMFYRMGAKCSISSPFYPYQVENVELGYGVSIGPFCRMETHPADRRNKQPKPMLQIGNRVRIEHNVNLSCHTSLIIGDHVLIAGGCYISDNSHSIDPEGTNYLEQPLRGESTIIENHVWLGQNVCVLAGSHIGERSIVGAGSVVSGVIPPYSVAVGAPARVIKQYSFETKKWEKTKNQMKGLA
jgi:acetyltransferase-like isoleucine patch superfamily enzyme